MNKRQRPHAGRATASTRRVFMVVAIAGLVAVAAGSCGVPRESDFQPFGPDQPFGVSTTTTSSSTTTTTSVPTTVIEVDETVTTATGTSTSSTSSTLVATEPVQLYFVVDTALTDVSRELARPASLRQVVAALEEGPPTGTPGAGLQSLIVSDLITNVVESDGQARVDLHTEVLSDIDTTDQRLVIAQLVLTLGVRPGVGQVSFSSDGDPLAVPVPSRGNLLSEPGEPLSRDDFAPLLTSSASDPGTTIDSVPTTFEPTTTGTEPSTTGTEPSTTDTEPSTGDTAPTAS